MFQPFITKGTSKERCQKISTKKFGENFPFGGGGGGWKKCGNIWNLGEGLDFSKMSEFLMTLRPHQKKE